MAEQAIIELRRWTDALEALINARKCKFIQRGVVLAETGSTQDAAARVSGGKPGLLVVAGRQSAGRGRLGRVWTQRDDLGLAATLTVRVAPDEQPYLSLAAGIAAARAVQAVLPPDVRTLIGLRWPNDVVERRRGRKIAGVLIEARRIEESADLVHLVGIGINVLQADADWSGELAGRAASVAQMGSNATRQAVLLALVESLEAALIAAVGAAPTRDRLLEEWKLREVLTGHEAEFLHNGKRFRGIVTAIEPTLHLTLRQAGGATVKLPAESTSLVHG